MNNHTWQNTKGEPITPETIAAASAAQRRYLSSPAAATLHGKTQGFVLRLPPQNKAHATFMQPLQCVLLQHVQIHSSQSPSFVAITLVTILRHHPPSPPFVTTLRQHPSSSLPSITTLRCLLLCGELLCDVLSPLHHALSDVLVCDVLLCDAL